MGFAPRRLIHASCKTTAVNPAAACGRSVVFELGKFIHELPVVNGKSIHLAKDGFRIGFVISAVNGIIPRQIQNGPIMQVVRPCVESFQATTEMKDEMEIAPAIA